MPRHLIAVVASASFAAYWAALQWPWLRHADDATGDHLGGWLLCAFFAFLAVALAFRKSWARWLGLAAAVLVLLLILVALPLAVGISQFNCDGVGNRCHFEFWGALACAATLVVALLKPFASNSTFKSRRSSSAA